MDNEEKDFTFIYKHEILDIEYVVKIRDFYETYAFFVFDSNDELCVKEVGMFLNKFKKQCNVDFDKIFYDIRNFDIKNIGSYVNSSKLPKYNLILDKLNDDFIKIGVLSEDKKLKRTSRKIYTCYDEKTCYDSLFNTLLFYIEELSIDTSNIKILENPTLDFPTSIPNKNDKNNYYLIKKKCSNNFEIITKDKDNEIFLTLKYNDINNIEFCFSFEKAKRGLVTPLLSKLNEFAIKEVSWDKLYSLYCDTSEGEIIVRNIYLEGQVEKLLVFKKYEMNCKVFDDEENIYFRILLEGINHPAKYSIN